jgi:hypothetical protein
MLEVVQAFDRAHIADLPTDDAAMLETRSPSAIPSCFRIAPAWRSHKLFLAGLMDGPYPGLEAEAAGKRAVGMEIPGIGQWLR